jgi:hypothetical protein
MLALIILIAGAPRSERVQQQDTLPIRLLEAAQRRQDDISRLRIESAHREATTQANLAQLNSRLRTASAELDRTAMAVAQTQNRQDRMGMLADAAPTLLNRLKSTEERILAANRATAFRASDRVVIIERGLDALRLKAHALNRTALAFNAGFDLSAVASPASFNNFDSALETLRKLSGERQRPALDMVVGWLKSGVPGIPVVSSIAGLVVNAFSSQSDNRRAADLKKAGEQMLCIAAVSQGALEKLGAVRRASERLERLSVEVEQRAEQGSAALRSAVGYPSGESFEAYMRRSFGDLASEDGRRDLPYNRLEPAMLSVAAAARLEYDLSRSSADLSAILGDAMLEPPAVPTCTDESKELAGRFDRLRPAVRDLRSSLAALASADDGIAVFVPPLPGR